MYLTCYLRKGVVYIPTLGAMDKGGGVFRDIEPVSVVPVSDHAALRDAILDNIERGNPRVPTVIGGDYGKPVVPSHAGCKSWSAFSKGTIPVSAQQKNGVYRIIGERKRRDRGWEPDPDQIFNLPEGATVDDLCDRLIEFLQTLAKKS